MHHPTILHNSFVSPVFAQYHFRGGIVFEGGYHQQRVVGPVAPAESVPQPTYLVPFRDCRSQRPNINLVLEYCIAVYVRMSLISGAHDDDL